MFPFKHATEWPHEHFVEENDNHVKFQGEIGVEGFNAIDHRIEESREILSFCSELLHQGSPSPLLVS